MVIVYNKKKMMVGCALMQAFYGGDQGSASLFDNKYWDMTPSDDLKPYTFKNADEVELLIKLTAEHHNDM